MISDLHGLSRRNEVFAQGILGNATWRNVGGNSASDWQTQQQREIHSAGVQSPQGWPERQHPKSERSLDQQSRAEAIGKLMADTPWEATSLQSNLVKSIIGLLTPGKTTLTSILQVTARGTANNQFFLGTLSICLAGTFRFCQLRACQSGKLWKRQGGDGAKTDAQRD